jgi:glutaredoxin
MNRITFFTRPDCPLCDAALFVVKKVRRSLPFELERVDISAPGSEAWAELYREHIPVVHLDGREVFRHRIDERRLRQLLRATHEPSAGQEPTP